MRNLDLTEMENIEGGGCTNTGLASIALGGSGWIMGALAFATITTGGLALWLVAGASLALAVYDCSSN